MSFEMVRSCLFKGKRKIITFPLVAGIFLWFWPFLLGFLASKRIYNKINQPKLRSGLIGIVFIITMFFGTAWVSALSSPTPSKQDGAVSALTTEITPTPIATATATVEKIPDEKIVKEEKDIEQADKQEYKVLKVVDGDTLDVSIGGKTERIRVIGINTPETVDPRKSVECFGKEASAKAKLFFEETGMHVQLVADTTQGERDKYGRLLRYVFTDDGAVDYGKVMISLGYANEYTYNVPYKNREVYREAEQKARSEGKGLWAEGACLATTPTKKVDKTTSTKSTVEANTPAVGVCKYSCSGPDKDCSDFSSHAEAQAFFTCCGFSAGNDPMRLDRATGTGNGVACESLP